LTTDGETRCTLVLQSVFIIHSTLGKIGFPKRYPKRERLAFLQQTFFGLMTFPSPYQQC